MDFYSGYKNTMQPYQRKLNNDVLRIKNYYKEQGYKDINVEYEVEYKTNNRVEIFFLRFPIIISNKGKDTSISFKSFSSFIFSVPFFYLYLLHEYKSIIKGHI